MVIFWTSTFPEKLAFFIWILACSMDDGRKSGNRVRIRDSIKWKKSFSDGRKDRGSG